MLSRKIKLTALPVAGLVAGLVLTPAIAYASGTLFSSSDSTTALSARNLSASGLAVNVRSVGPRAAQVTSAGTGSGASLYVKTTATGERSNAISGVSSATTGEHYGLYGVNYSDTGAAVIGENRSQFGLGVLGVGYGGVLGLGSYVGVEGDTFGGTPGDGSYGLVTGSDIGTSGHLVEDQSNVAGTCTVPASQTTVTCAFGDPFGAGITPIVTVTPTGNPGGYFWVASATPAGFDINLSAAPAADLVFNWTAVGHLPAAAAASPTSRAKQLRSETATARR